MNEQKIPVAQRLELAFPAMSTRAYGRKSVSTENPVTKLVSKKKPVKKTTKTTKKTTTKTNSQLELLSELGLGYTDSDDGPEPQNNTEEKTVRVFQFFTKESFDVPEEIGKKILVIQAMMYQYECAEGDVTEEFVNKMDRLKMEMRADPESKKWFDRILD